MTLTALVCLVATEEGRVLNVEAMDGLRFPDDHPLERPPQELRFEWVDQAEGEVWQKIEAAREKEREWRLDEWRREQQAGRGIELQRALVASSLTEWVPPYGLATVWDEAGPRIEEHAVGVKEIVGVHLRSIFVARPLGVFACSICGRPYAISEERRRPRQGARRLCSDACRAEAKRRANLASWHKNKAKWLRDRRQREATDG